MKISSIKNISLNKTISLKSNPIKSRKMPNDTFELSFGSRIKHSRGFLELTKDMKDFRGILTIFCMLNEKGEFDPELEEDFVELAKLYSDSKADDKTRLTTLAFSLNAARKQGEAKYLPFFIAKIKEMYAQGLNFKDIQSIFNWEEFDINSPKAFLILNDIFGDELSMSDKKIFLMKYCKNENWETDVLRIPEILKVFKFFAVDELDEADILYAMMYDDDMTYNPDKCKFLYEASLNLLGYAKKHDKNAIQMIKNEPEQTKNLIYLLMNALMNSSQNKDGKFSIKKARENFVDWFDYAQNNRDTINSLAQIRIHNGNEEKYEYFTIGEYMKKVPQRAYFVDNIIYRLSNVVSNTPQIFQ